MNQNNVISPTIIENIFSKIECESAIALWASERSSYDNIEELIEMTQVFNLDVSICAGYQNKSYIGFHTYLGVFKGLPVIGKKKLGLIIVPVKSDGQEESPSVLSGYQVAFLANLQSAINFSESIVRTTTHSTVLSQEITIESYAETKDWNNQQEPYLNEYQAIRDIISWKDQGLDWFYQQCNNNNGANIVQVFDVPFLDVIPASAAVTQIHCFFAFKFSSVINAVVPTLIFSDIINTVGKIKKTTESILDFSSPCPPFCKKKKLYELLTGI
jgi:hypothetical protein